MFRVKQIFPHKEKKLNVFAQFLVLTSRKVKISLLAEVSHGGAKMRDRERPLLAGKVKIKSLTI